MNGALLELVWRGLRGALVRRARRLRQPRYLIAFLLSAAYFGFLVLPGFLRSARQAREAFPPDAGGAARAARTAAALGGGEAAPALLAMASALVLAAVLTLMWAFVSSKPALRLSEADINLLLPAPVPRRKLIELAVWRQQAGLVFGALVVTLFRGAGPPAARLAMLLTTWALLSLIGLHSQGVSLWKARLRELPPAAARRRIGVAVAIGVAWWTAVVLALRGALAAPAATTATATAAAATALGAAPGGAGGTAGLGEALRRLGTAPPPLLWWLLAPCRWVVTTVLGAGGLGAGVLPVAGGAAGVGGPAGSGFPGGGLAATGGLGRLAGYAFLVTLVAAHYEWVVRSRARFEDAVLERARRQLARRLRQPALPALTARARRREPFRLAAVGLPEAAIYWKNLLTGGRRPLAQRAALVALAGVAAWAVGAALGAPLSYVAPVAGGGVMLMLLIPPFAGLNLRHDLRLDLLQVEVLRPWPVPGWRLVAAELLAPATTACTWTLAGYGVMLGAVLAGPERLPRLGRLAAAAGVAAPAAGGHAGAAGGAGMVSAAAALGLALLIAGAPVTLLSSALQNVAALSFPGWVALGPERRGASGLAGQRLLVLLAQVLALAAGLLPPLLLVGAALLAESWLGLAPSPWQAPLLALLGALPVLVEVGLLVRAGGALWDRLDPAQELLSQEE